MVVLDQVGFTDTSATGLGAKHNTTNEEENNEIHKMKKKKLLVA